MNDGRIPNRYAKALYKLAEEKGQTKEVYEQMKTLSTNYVVANNLQQTMVNPHISSADKENILRTASGAPAGGCVDKFVALVIKNNRISFMQTIALDYQKIYRNANNLAKVVITTASQMSSDELDKIKGIVSKAYPDKKLEFEVNVNPELIGGFTVQIDSTLLDASINNELKKLRLRLLS